MSMKNPVGWFAGWTPSQRGNIKPLVVETPPKGPQEATKPEDKAERPKQQGGWLNPELAD